MSDGTMLQQLSPSEAHQLLQAGSPLVTQAAAHLHGLVFVAQVLKAGPVMVEVSVGGVQLQPNWPRSLLVLPDKPAASHCAVEGLCKVQNERMYEHLIVSIPHACSSRHVTCYSVYKACQVLQNLTWTAA